MAAESYIVAHSAGWKNAKSADQWRASLATHADPRIGNKNVADIDVEDLLTILRPIWTTKNVTATRVRGRIESILDSGEELGALEGWRLASRRTCPRIAGRRGSVARLIGRLAG